MNEHGTTNAHTPCCPREEAVLAAARVGRWPDDLADHFADCAVCAEAVLVRGALLELAAESAGAPLPPASTVYRHAERLARQQAINRATRSIVLWQRVAGAVSAAIAAVGAGWLWPRAIAFAAGGAGLLPQVPSPSVGGGPFLLVGIVVLFLAAAGSYMAWAEE